MKTILKIMVMILGIISMFIGIFNLNLISNIGHTSILLANIGIGLIIIFDYFPTFKKELKNEKKNRINKN